MMNSKGMQELSMMNSTINKDTILEKKEIDEKNIYSKGTKIIDRYKQYKRDWEKQSKNIRARSVSAPNA